MMSKIKLMSGLSVFTLFAFLLPVLAQGQLIISNNETGTRAVVTPRAITTSTTTATTTTVTTTTSTTTTVSATTSTSTCVNFINNFHTYGNQGTEVAKLQNFLNQYSGAKLNGLGFYGPATMQAVKNLQYTYGIKATGVQHVKTTALINGIVCGQIAVRAPMTYTGVTYTGAYRTYTQGTTGTSVTTNMGQVNMNNVYPNPAPAVKPVTTGSIKGNPNEYIPPTKTATVTKASSTTSTSTLWNTLKADYEKIKENYKAYVLVFVLVLALFWFLRKAATE